MEDDQNIHVCFKRSKLFPRFINDNREGKTVKSYIGSRYNGDSVNALYRILPGDSLSGERPRSLFITKSDGSEVIYKMVGCKDSEGYQLMTFQRLDK